MSSIKKYGIHLKLNSYFKNNHSFILLKLQWPPWATILLFKLNRMVYDFTRFLTFEKSLSKGDPLLLYTDIIEFKKKSKINFLGTAGISRGKFFCDIYILFIVAKVSKFAPDLSGDGGPAGYEVTEFRVTGEGLGDEV